VSDRSEPGFWDNVTDTIIEEVEYALIKCEFDKCPFLAVKGSFFCPDHQKESGIPEEPPKSRRVKDNVS
jgi:hypothetical protein